MLQKRICEECGGEFTAAPLLHQRFCSMKCKRAANNRTYYANHKESVIGAVIARRGRGMKKAAKKIANVVLPESISFDVDDDIGDIEID